jgi:hypothetical protein
MGLVFKEKLGKREVPFLVVANSDVNTIAEALRNWDIKYHFVAKLKRKTGEKLLKII